MDLLTPLAKHFKILRIGQSARADLEKKFGLKVNPKEEQAQIKIQKVLQEAQIVVCASFSLHSNSLEKSQILYDTVIIDDASMISEADTVSALKHGCLRAVLLGNQMLTQGLFLLNPSSAHRTLF